MALNIDVNEGLKDIHRHLSMKLRKIDGVFFDKAGTPLCSACISPVDNQPVGLSLKYVNKMHPDYSGGLFVYTCPQCKAEFNIAGNTLATAKANTPNAQ
jgi:hypothetical protein